MKLSEQFRSGLLSCMEKSGIRQHDLATTLDVTDGYISILLIPDRNYTVLTLEKLAEALGMEWEVRLVAPK